MTKFEEIDGVELEHFYVSHMSLSWEKFVAQFWKEKNLLTSSQILP